MLCRVIVRGQLSHKLESFLTRQRQARHLMASEKNKTFLLNTLFLIANVPITSLAPPPLPHTPIYFGI